MADLKHVGQIKSSGRKCVIAYRTLPGDAFNCLLIPTESLPDSYHDALMQTVESNAAQTAFELAEVLNRSTFPDGSNMLVSLHIKGFLSKVPTDDVVMIPNSYTSVGLAELNQLIAQNQGVSVQDLAIKPDIAEEDVAKIDDITPPNRQEETFITHDEELSDDERAKKYRQEADRLSKEAAYYRKKAEELVPTIKGKAGRPRKTESTTQPA